jgi:hypothetical protein
LLAKTLSAEVKEIKRKSILNIYHRKDGSLSEFRILRDMGYGTGEEAIRVIKLSPHWIQDNKPVRVEYSLPITNRLIFTI